jgi:hypothetical protein
MHESRFAARLAKGPLHGPMIGARHFDGHDVVANAVLLAGFAKLNRGQLQLGLLMLDDTWRDEHLAIEVAQHPLRTGLRAIHRDDAESLRPDGPHPLVDDPLGFAKCSLSNRAISARFTLCNHSNGSCSGKEVKFSSHSVQLEWFL